MIDRVQNFGSSFESQVGELKDKTLELPAATRERLAKGREALRFFVADHPAKALGLALGIGVFLGWLIKRR